MLVQKYAERGAKKMTGEDLIKWIQETHSENAYIIVWDKFGMLKNATEFTVRPIEDGNDEKHLGIVIE